MNVESAAGVSVVHPPSIHSDFEPEVGGSVTEISAILLTHTVQRLTSRMNTRGDPELETNIITADFHDSALMGSICVKLVEEKRVVKIKQSSSFLIIELSLLILNRYKWIYADY
jgi:hypothetical protein